MSEEPFTTTSEERLIGLTITEVRSAVPLRPGQEAGLVVVAELEEPFRALHIYIGQAEARAIQAGQRGEHPSRPSTWDLLILALELYDARLVKAVIDGAEEKRHFFATLRLEGTAGAHNLACRPSDAIALVVRTPGAGLFATEQVLAEAGHYP
ncbi:MAG TPA: bifunctional nuclease family protein [Acidimicrobiales bacterium]|nr:bifunctional nuclease family protein [Acidimicrobiales bacterium]